MINAWIGKQSDLLTLGQFAVNLGVMLHQYLRRRARIIKGLLRTRLRRQQQLYDPHNWWDRVFFQNGLSDEHTVSPNKGALTTKYHYSSVELLLLRYLCSIGFNLQDRSVCDLGSGSGHWIDFYSSIGASRCVGVDISQKAVEFLEHKYLGNDSIEIRLGNICDVMSTLSESVDLVNAIGVMFHIVDDREWEETIRLVGCSLNSGGLFVVGGHFGWMNNANVQLDQHNAVWKRLRSSSQWKRSLKRSGFRNIRIYRNPAFMFINDWIPENSLLVARKA